MSRRITERSGEAGLDDLDRIIAIALDYVAPVYGYRSAAEFMLNTLGAKLPHVAPGPIETNGGQDMPDFWQQVRDIAAEAAKAAVAEALATRNAASTGAGYTQPQNGGGTVYVAAVGKTLPTPIAGETMLDYAKRAADALAGGDAGLANFYRGASGMLADADTWRYGADQRTWPEALGRWSRAIVTLEPQTGNAPPVAPSGNTPGGLDAAGGLHSQVDAELPRGTPGTTWFDEFGGVNLPAAFVDSQGRPEGPASYVERVSRILSKGDPAKQWALVQSRGGLAAGYAGSYGYTADPASFPKATIEFARQIFATPGQGTVATGIPQGQTVQDVQIG